MILVIGFSFIFLKSIYLEKEMFEVWLPQGKYKFTNLV